MNKPLVLAVALVAAGVSQALYADAVPPASAPQVPAWVTESNQDSQIVLKTLASQGRMHGYAITLRIEEISENVLRLEEGSLYPALHRLEQQGCVRMTQIVKPMARPPGSAHGRPKSLPRPAFIQVPASPIGEHQFRNLPNPARQRLFRGLSPQRS